MVVTVNKIVEKAGQILRLSGDQFDALPGYVADRAIDELNKVLQLTPLAFVSYLDFQVTAGQQEIDVRAGLKDVGPPKEYYEFDSPFRANRISDEGGELIAIQNLLIKDLNNEYRIILRQMNANEYYDAYQSNIVTRGRPFRFYFELSPQADLSVQTKKIYLHPVPDTTYDFRLVGRWAVIPIEAGEFLENIEVPDKWEDFLIYSVAKRLSMYYGSSYWLPKHEEMYNKLAAEAAISYDRPRKVKVDEAMLGGYYGDYYRSCWLL